MNVDQRFLNDSKERGLGVERQPLDTLGQIDLHLDAGAQQLEKRYESGGAAERQGGHRAGLGALSEVDHAVRGVGSATKAPSAACLRKCSSTNV